MREMTRLLTDMPERVGPKSMIGPVPCRPPGRVDTRHEQRVLGRGWELSGTVGSPGRARKLVRACLAEWGIEGESVDAVELIVSELVTNSVTHAGTGRVWCRLERADGVVRIEVCDEGRGWSGVPEPLGAGGSEDECGRGLFLVAHAASSWGSYQAQAGRVVWAHVAAPRPRAG
ncbi:ATP-binding protein [Streptomyces werraensis]|uniref:ATP-binding protein n=1 Tax=Streptomyces werraensis TaxID=68284 RepID=UPI003B514D60